MKKAALALWVLLAAGAAHAESARTVRATELHADSQSDATVLSTLPENTTLDVLQRRGAWSQVKSGAQSGWVRMLNLRFDANSGGATTAAPASGSGKPAGGLSSLIASGRTSNSGTDTTGVRGMTDEDLSRAQANLPEFQKMQGYASDKNAAQTFGKNSRLTVVQVPYFADSGAADSKSSRSGSN
jgi:hypothetical protein